MKEPLFKTILNLCGVTDTDNVNHVVINITKKNFNVSITYNSKTTEGKFIIEGDAVVQITKKFKLVEVD